MLHPLGLRPRLDPELEGLRALVDFASRSIRRRRARRGGASSVMKARDAVQLRVQQLVIDQLNLQPELPPGWELLGAELVVVDELGQHVRGEVRLK